MGGKKARQKESWRKREAAWTTTLDHPHIGLNAMLVADLVHAQEAYSGDPHHPNEKAKEDNAIRSISKSQHDRGVGAETVRHPGGTEFVQQLRRMTYQEIDGLCTSTSPDGGDTQIDVIPPVFAHPVLLSPNRPADLETPEAWITRHKRHLS